MEEDIKMLIATFKEYRDLIGPIEENLREFSSSFESVKADISLSEAVKRVEDATVRSIQAIKATFPDYKVIADE